MNQSNKMGKGLKLSSLLILLISVLSCTSKKQTVDLTPVLEVEYQAKLGEGALWDYKYQRFLWIDINGKKLNIFNPKTKHNKQIELPLMPGTVVPIDKQHLLLGLEDGIYKINVETEVLEKMCEPETGKPTNRFNDGKCDPAGRFWAGTHSKVGEKRNSSLYKINGDYTSKEMLAPVSISNGIVWSADKSKMYYIDTPTKKVVEYTFNNETGEISSPRDAIIIPETMGYPDGSTIDKEGKIWIALWGGACVTRWDPITGKLLQKIEVPAKNVTSCAFGGKNLNTLYITSASMAMNNSDKLKYPNAGKLYSVKPGVSGTKCFYFAEE